VRVPGDVFFILFTREFLVALTCQRKAFAILKALVEAESGQRGTENVTSHKRYVKTSRKKNLKTTKFENIS